MTIAEAAFALLKPSNALAVLFLVGTILLWTSHSALGRGVLSITVAALVIVTVLPVGRWLMLPLEGEATTPPLPVSPAGIILLGGYFDGLRSTSAYPFALSDAAERVTAAAALALRFPAAPLIVTDGASDPALPSGALVSARLLEGLGVPASQIVQETEARSTWDNAVFTKRLVNPEAGQRFVLVTSAWHMKRAFATFRAAGWPDLVAYPVDYATDPPSRWGMLGGSFADRLSDLDKAAREWSAIAYYWVNGRLKDFSL